jgi:hypothetical protein
MSLHIRTRRFIELVHRAEQLLDLKRMAASTTADFATLPSNILKRELYWTMPPPLAMVGVAVADIIDIDEAGFFLESSNRNFGKTVLCLRCSQNGVCMGGVGVKKSIYSLPKRR